MPPKTAIVTGGASGIGLAIVKYLAQTREHEVAHIALLDVNPTAGEEALDSLNGEYPNATFSFHTCDVTSWEKQAEVFESIYTKQGHVDLVCANAGIPETGFLFQTTGDRPVKTDLKTYDIDLTGAIYTVSLAAFYISKNKSQATSPYKGSIICTASNAGFYPLSLAPIYTIAKHGVVGMVRGLAGRFQHEHIQINGIAPCIVETKIGASVKGLPGIVYTPLSAVTRAVGMLLSDSKLNGMIAEISEENITFPAFPAYVDESTKNNLAILGNLAQQIWSGNFSHGGDK